MAWTIEYRQPVRKTIDKLGAYWRYPVGDYRIICDIQDGKLIVLVVEIGHRSSVYR